MSGASNSFPKNAFLIGGKIKKTVIGGERGIYQEVEETKKLLHKVTAKRGGCRKKKGGVRATAERT